MTQVAEMTEPEDSELTELDRLLNDPDVPMQAARVWELLDKVSSRELQPAL